MSENLEEVLSSYVKLSDFERIEKLQEYFGIELLPYQKWLLLLMLKKEKIEEKLKQNFYSEKNFSEKF